MRRLTTLAATVVCFLLTTSATRANADTDQLLKAIKGSDAQARVEALDEIDRLGPNAKSFVNALAELLASDDDALHWRVARTLGAIGPDAGAAVPALTEMLDDDNSRCRAYAVFALGNIGEAAKPAATKIVELGFDDDPLVRRAVVNALLNIRAPLEVTLPVVLKMLESPDSANVMPALHAMAEAGAKAVPRLCEVLKHPEGCYWACLVLAEIGPEAKSAVPHLAKVLEHADPEVRMQALVALGEIGTPSAAAEAAIVERLRDVGDGSKKNPGESLAVRYAAAFALGQIGEAGNCLPDLIEATASDDAFLRVVAAWALTQVDPNNAEQIKRSAEEFAKALQSPAAEVRIAAARALAESNAPSDIVAPALVKALERADEEVIAHATDAFASLGAKAVPRVIRGLTNEHLRVICAGILAEIGPEAAEAVPALLDALEVNDAEFQKEVQFALGSIGPAAIAATPALIKMLNSDNDELQYSACYALGKIGPGAVAAVDPLIKKFDSNDPFLKLSSVWAMLQIMPRDEEVASAAAPLLIQALAGDDREHVRVEAAASLGDIADRISGPAMVFRKKLQAAVPVLQEAADNDSSPAVREAAAGSLKKLRAAANEARKRIGGAIN